MLEVFGKGIYNIVENDKIPSGASSNSLGWKTKDTHIELSRGRVRIGDLFTGTGKVRGFHIAHKSDGTPVKFRKVDTKIQYYNTSTDTWTDIITGLTSDAFYTFNDYISLAGNFVYATGKDGCWKLDPANPNSAKNLTNTSKSPTGTSDYGKSLISNSRMFSWDLEKNPTGLYLSFIDSLNYSATTGEAVGSGGTTFSGTLSNVTGTNTCFAVSFTDGTQTLIDDKNGGFTGDGTGTINYITGEYNITFNNTAGTVTADYNTEDSNNGGITDFTFSSPRVAGEGDMFPQEYGGKKIMNVIPYNGKYYSIKDRSIYELYLTNDDTNATNQVYNPNIGSLYFGSSTPTSLGIVFLDTSNPEYPKLTRMTQNRTGDQLIPTELAPHFDFSKYDWSECQMDTFGEDIIFTGKENSENNNRLFRYNSRLKSIDVYAYEAQNFAKDNGLLYVGDSISNNVYQIFTGWDDDEAVIKNFWESKAERFGEEKLKRYKWQVIKGLISKDQKIEVYIAYDNGSYQLVETIEGTADYVDTSQAVTIGATEVGQTEIGGGGNGINAYYFYHEFKVRTPKFAKRRLKFKATGLGYASISFIDEKELQISGSSRRVPKKYRV